MEVLGEGHFSKPVEKGRLHLLEKTTIPAQGSPLDAAPGGEVGSGP